MAAELPDPEAFDRHDDTGVLPPRTPAAARRDGDSSASGGGGSSSGGGDEIGPHGAESDGHLRVVALHRRGPPGAGGSPPWFGAPTVVAARRAWSLLDLKRHVVAQLAHLVEPPPGPIPAPPGRC